MRKKESIIIYYIEVLRLIRKEE